MCMVRIRIQCTVPRWENVIANYEVRTAQNSRDRLAAFQETLKYEYLVVPRRRGEERGEGRANENLFSPQEQTQN